MFSIIPLPVGFIDDILANIETILTDLGGYIALIISVLLGAIILEVIIGAIRNR